MNTKNLIITLLDYLISKYQFSDNAATNSPNSSLSQATSSNSSIEDTLDFSDFPTSPTSSESLEFPLEDILSQIPDFTPVPESSTPQNAQGEFPQSFDDFDFE